MGTNQKEQERKEMTSIDDLILGLLKIAHPAEKLSTYEIANILVYYKYTLL